VDDDTAGFHRRYYDSRVWTDTRWLGVSAQKCPLDLWIYQEILAETRPGLIVETGTADGGSALYLASVCDLLEHGHVVTIDVAEAERPSHPRIRYLHGSSIDPVIVDKVRRMAAGASAVMVVLDSDHAAARHARLLPDRRGHERQRPTGAARARARPRRGRRAVPSRRRPL
jgi:cephalosporin hydroxylase